MTWAILVINNKGGTGKSTVAVELAKALRDDDHNVGIMDADIDSANLSSRLGCDEKVTFTGDHVIQPVEHEGMKLYSMENAFEESTFSQTGEFMGNVIESMINQSDWGEMDYMVVDCPPGSSDVFDNLVRALRPSIKGAVSVGISDALDDTVRLVKVCNHNWVQILGFIENMSGIVSAGEPVTCNKTGEYIYPFGRGNIKNFADEVGGNYLGDIPLCTNGTEIQEVAGETIDDTITAIEDSGPPELKEENIGDKSFIKSVWGTIKNGVEQMNSEMDINGMQDQFGVENRDPLVISLKLTDAGPISGIFDEVIITVDGGELKVMRPRKAKRKGIEVEAGMEIESQDLYDAVRGEKKVMRSVTGEVTTEPYSITKAVQMGDAKIWGDKTVNRLAVLDRILSDAVDMDEVREGIVQ